MQQYKGQLCQHVAATLVTSVVKARTTLLARPSTRLPVSNNINNIQEASGVNDVTWSFSLFFS
jgi:hypothetical protein